MDIAARVMRMAERRAEPRHGAGVAARIRHRSAASAEARLIDVSAGGCRLSPAAGLGEGDLVWIEIAGVATRHARVAWTDGKAAGCRFATPLDPAELRLAMALDREPGG